MTNDDHTVDLDSLLCEHDAIISAMLEGRRIPYAPSRLRRVNARIHAAYTRFALVGAQYLPHPDLSLRAVRHDDYDPDE